ncbi:ribosome-inactivating family protein [Streptomyces sp. URMC 126]|uniref:ribosome-inactivating family protein n=1 Tax=Streptomyces sp. URMC 126 TaxID=3423401 RepID=UPI003F1D0314
MRKSRLVRSLILSGAGLALAVTGTLTTAGTAQARTEWRHMSHVYINLADEGASEHQQNDYSTFVQSLRNAAAGYNTQETQLENVGIIQASLTAPDDRGARHQVRIWINPSNLYIWGFSNERGTTYQFNDINGALAGRLRETTDPRPDVDMNVQTLNFGSNYNSLTGTAGRGREAMTISYNDIRASLVQLATVNNPNSGNERQNTARSLSLVIQMLSEAARFNDVEGTFRTAMGTWEFQYGLPHQQQELENSWDSLSEYYHRVSAGQNATAPFIPSIGRINGLDQVRRYLRLALGSTGMANGNWNHDEL